MAYISGYKTTTRSTSTIKLNFKLMIAEGGGRVVVVRVMSNVSRAHKVAALWRTPDADRHYSLMIAC